MVFAGLQDVEVEDAGVFQCCIHTTLGGSDTSSP